MSVRFGLLLSACLAAATVAHAQAGKVQSYQGVTYTAAGAVSTAQAVPASSYNPAPYRANTPHSSRWAIAPSIGTDGIGVDLKYALTRTVVLRARAAGVRLHKSVDSDGIHYNGKAQLGTGGGFVDWHPFANGFVLSGGAVYGRRQLDVTGTPTMGATINGHAYAQAQIGTVSGSAKFPDAAAFAGIGYDSTFVHPGALGFNLLAGVEVSNKPTVHLTSTGALANTPQLQNDVRQEERNIRKTLESLRYYPAVSAGVSYRF